MSYDSTNNNNANNEGKVNNYKDRPTEEKKNQSTALNTKGCCVENRTALISSLNGNNWDAIKISNNEQPFIVFLFSVQQVLIYGVSGGVIYLLIYLRCPMALWLVVNTAI